MNNRADNNRLNNKGTRRSLVLANERPEAWDQHLADYIARYQPTSDLEHEMVEDIAFCRWLLIRMRTIDTALWDKRMEEQARISLPRIANPRSPFAPGPRLRHRRHVPIGKPVRSPFASRVQPRHPRPRAAPRLHGETSRSMKSDEK